jgi:hypothetical protein
MSVAFRSGTARAFDFTDTLNSNSRFMLDLVVMIQERLEKWYLTLLRQAKFYA